MGTKYIYRQEDERTAKQLYDDYNSGKYSLPMMAVCNRGFYSSRTETTFSTGQILRLHAVRTQRRAVIHTRERKTVSVPVSFPTLFLVKSRSEQLTLPLTEIVERCKLPVKILFADPHVQIDTEDSQTTGHAFGWMEVVGIHDEAYFIANSVDHNDKPLETVIPIPLYLKEITFCPVRGVARKVPGGGWAGGDGGHGDHLILNSLMEQMAQHLKHVDFTQDYSDKAMVQLSDKPLKMNDHYYENIEHNVYINISQIVRPKVQKPSATSVYEDVTRFSNAHVYDAVGNKGNAKRHSSNPDLNRGDRKLEMTHEKREDPPLPPTPSRPPKPTTKTSDGVADSLGSGNVYDVLAVDKELHTRRTSGLSAVTSNPTAMKSNPDMTSVMPESDVRAADSKPPPLPSRPVHGVPTLPARPAALPELQKALSKQMQEMNTSDRGTAVDSKQSKIPPEVAPKTRRASSFTSSNRNSATSPAATYTNTQEMAVVKPVGQTSSKGGQQGTVQPASTTHQRQLPTSAPSKPDLDWNRLPDMTVAEVGQVLEELGLNKYCTQFASERVDGRLLTMLDDQTLREDFGLSRIETIRLMAFVNEGHKPKW